MECLFRNRKIVGRAEYQCDKSIELEVILKNSSGFCGHALPAMQVSGGSMEQASNENAGRDTTDYGYWCKRSSPQQRTGRTGLIQSGGAVISNPASHPSASCRRAVQ